MLIFESINSYEKIVNNEEGGMTEDFLEYVALLPFDNYFSNQSNFNGDNTEKYMDEQFGQILNAEGVVQIGTYVLRVDMENELVFVIATEDKEKYYQDLISGNKECEQIDVYSFDDDILQILDEGVNEKCSGVASGIYWGYGGVGPTHEAPIINSTDNGNVYRLNPYVRYFKAGIFFKLTSGYEIYRFASPTSVIAYEVTGPLGLGVENIEVFCKYPQGWYRKKPCGTGTVGTQAGGYYYSGSNYKHKQTFYGGTRGLNGYYFFVQARAKYTGGLVSIATLYAGRNINSPY